MSFRKRSEIIEPGAGRINPGTRAVPTVPVSGRTPVSLSRGGPVTGRGGQVGPIAPGNSINRQVTKSPIKSDAILSHPAVKPSIITSSPMVSTGTPDLDKILFHHGLPLGHSLLIEERGNTDFSSILLKVFASQGVLHNRMAGEKKEINSHVVVIGHRSDWANELPGLFLGSKKEQQRAKISENESKVSISNLADSSKSQRDGMKIAWRYELQKKAGLETDSNTPAASGNGSENFCYQCDITLKISPVPSAVEMSFVPLLDSIPQQVKSIVEQNVKNNRIVRIVMPHLLHPMIYSPEFSSPFKLLPLMHSLRSIVKQYPQNVVLLASLPTELYDRRSSLTQNIELLMDSVIELQQFNQEMTELMEKSYKNEPSKILHGLVQIYKLPLLSERGLMMVHTGEYAFKNGKKKFEIEEWGIPVEDDSKDEQQTTKDVEF